MAGAHHTILPVTPAQVERLCHDQTLGGSEYRLWLWCCSHLRTEDGKIEVSVRDLQRGPGFRTITRALLSLNILIEGGFIVIHERKWNLSRLSGLVLSVASRVDSSPPAARRVAVFHQRV